MPRQPNVAQILQKDYCRHCGKVIQLLPNESNRYSSAAWRHVDIQDTEDEQRSLYCEGEYAKFHKRALPRSFCWESMNRGSWHSEYCGRPVKEPERFMCGIHANFARKAEEREQEWKESWELTSYVADQMREIVKKFKEEYDLDVEYNHNALNPRIIVDHKALWELLWGMEEHF